MIHRNRKHEEGLQTHIREQSYRNKWQDFGEQDPVSDLVLRHSCLVSSCLALNSSWQVWQVFLRTVLSHHCIAESCASMIGETWNPKKIDKKTRAKSFQFAQCALQLPRHCHVSWNSIYCRCSSGVCHRLHRWFDVFNSSQWRLQWRPQWRPKWRPSVTGSVSKRNRSGHFRFRKWINTGDVIYQIA